MNQNKIEDCQCGNTQFGFECNYVNNHPGDNEYLCEYCGIYKASEPTRLVTNK